MSDGGVDDRYEDLADDEVDAERCILGAIMLFPDILDDVAEILTAADFFEPRNQLVFAAMQSLATRSASIDLVLLADELGDDLERAGGVARLSALDASVGSATRAKEYAEVVKDASDRRRAGVVAQRVLVQARDPSVPLATTLGEAHAAIIGIEDRTRAVVETGIAPLLKNLWTTLQYRMENPGPTGMVSGLKALDELTGGANAGDLWIIGARPGVGKTSLVTQYAVNVATGGHGAWHGSLPVYIASLEMSAAALTQRIACSQARIDSQRAQQGRFHETDWPKLARAGEALMRAPLDIEYMGGRTAAQIRTGARKALKKRRKEGHKKFGMIAVDYLQLVASDGTARGMSETDRIGKISMALKHLAEEFECPVLCLSQLSRESDKRTDKRPIMSDLRSSGNIEQDADLVLLLHRESLYDKGLADKTGAEGIVAKNRNGPVGTAQMKFEGEFTLFSNIYEQGAMRPDHHSRSGE